jgi:hypothetical protein
VTATSWCCEAFRNHYDSGGNRGLAVLIERTSNGEPLFIFQSRSVGKDELPVSSDLSITFAEVTEGYIAFCPWCGKPLRQQYEKNVDLLSRPGLKVDVGF